MHHDDDVYFQSQYDDRGRSQTPPFAPYAYPPPEEMIVQPYSSPQSYHTMTTAEAYPNYMASTLPCTLPSMTHFSDAIKREPYTGEEAMPPYPYMNNYVPVDVNGHGPYDRSNPHVSHVRNQSHHHQRS
jgi:hypothetical protein